MTGSPAASGHFLIVAIDGGAASGKSSTARALSERFGLLHADTGSYFRALTAEMLRRGVAPADAPGIRAALDGIVLATRIEGRSATMEIGGQAAGEEIRGAEVNAAVSHFAAIPELRAKLATFERGQAGVARANGFRGLVMDGRDIGTVIFPDAAVRFFLHADPGERTRRRAREGQSDAVLERDRLDSTRATAPLICPPGAVSIDTTHRPLVEVVELMAAAVAAGIAP
ncbi:MAG: (d)CMP kinase [Opitutaceae bacterium]